MLTNAVNSSFRVPADAGAEVVNPQDGAAGTSVRLAGVSYDVSSAASSSPSDDGWDSLLQAFSEFEFKVEEEALPSPTSSSPSPLFTPRTSSDHPLPLPPPAPPPPPMPAPLPVREVPEPRWACLGGGSDPQKPQE